MRVFKFGGASVKDSESVRNIPKILSGYRGEKLVVIISAMGKTTNALEAITRAAYDNDAKAEQLFQNLYDYHMQIARELFPDEKHEIFTQLESLFDDLRSWMEVLAGKERELTYDMYYDQMVPVGELLSTRIVSNHLQEEGIGNTWLDAREMIITDNTYRDAVIDWQRTHDKIMEKTGNAWKDSNIVVSQGFIGHNGEYSTTLGREGSDFSAAIFANVLDAEEVVVWKDVPGYLNADP
ncbi:MAG: aspartate kinase, partial [Bacteroidetes bacterium]|nr:aspartate kinase [Bacteroidota bacterium]